MGTKTRKGGIFRTVGKVVLGVIAAAAFALAIGAIAMVLWNWLMPVIFGLGVITYWQAFGIVLLAKLLFGFGGMGGHDHDNDCEREPGPIRKEIRKEFRKEWDKEMDKEMDKEARKDMRGRMRRHFHTKCDDDAFEEWWEKEGAAGFETYAKQDKDEDE